MPLARILTRHSRKAADVARTLRAAGYEVEVAPPHVTFHGVADLEINLDEPESLGPDVSPEIVAQLSLDHVAAQSQMRPRREWGQPLRAGLVQVQRQVRKRAEKVEEQIRRGWGAAQRATRGAAGKGMAAAAATMAAGRNRMQGLAVRAGEVGRRGLRRLAALETPSLDASRLLQGAVLAALVMVVLLAVWGLPESRHPAAAAVVAPAMELKEAAEMPRAEQAEAAQESTETAPPGEASPSAQIEPAAERPVRRDVTDDVVVYHGGDGKERHVLRSPRVITEGGTDGEGQEVIIRHLDEQAKSSGGPSRGGVRRISDLD